MKLLVISNESKLVSSVVPYFTSSGDLCESASDDHNHLAKLQLHDYDCIILHTSIRNSNGLLLHEIVKQRHGEGIMVISEQQAVAEKVMALEAGADDYLVIPFDLSELKARVKAIVRRTICHVNDILTFEEVIIDLSARLAFVNGENLNLTQKELTLLIYLVKHKNKLITKDNISAQLSGNCADSAEYLNAIYSHMRNLKKKLAEQGCTDYIQSVYSIGYRLAKP